MPNANNPRLVAWQELRCQHTAHSRLMKLFDDTDSNGLQLEELRLVYTRVFGTFSQ